MRLSPTFAVILGAVALSTSATAQTAPAISVQTLKDVTKTLSSDAYEGRKPTTPGEDKATDYIVARFKAAGRMGRSSGGFWTGC